MNIIEVQQGSPEWLAVRAKHFTASEAAAAMGLSKYQTRDQLLRQKSSGITEEVSEQKQRLFNQGHASEAAARPIVEARIGEDLFPCTATLEVDGLPLLASMDGLTMGEDRAWENKLMNAPLLAAIQSGEVPNTHWPQLEQGLLVTGAEKVYFTVSDGTEEGTVGVWYQSRPERRAQLIAAWKQFAEDLANYKAVEVIPAAIAAPIEELPVLTVELVGQVQSTNLTDWQGAVMARIQAINTDLKTDDDFATAKKTVSFLDDGEKRLDLVKSQALAQTSSIDELFRTIDTLKGEMRNKRLNLDKLVKARETAIKVEIQQEAKDVLAEHIANLNKRLGKNYMPTIAADFAVAMKNKRTIASLRDAVDTEMARAKIESNEIAGRIQDNLNSLRELAKDHTFLFSDAAQIVMKANDDLVMLIKSRISEHTAKEAERLEAERTKIRAEEEVRAAAKAKAEQEAIEAQRKASEPTPATTNTTAGLASAPANEGTRETPALSQRETLQSAPMPITSQNIASFNYRARIDGMLDCLFDNDLQKVLEFVGNLVAKQEIAA